MDITSNQKIHVICQKIIYIYMHVFIYIYIYIHLHICTHTVCVCAYISIYLSIRCVVLSVRASSRPCDSLHVKRFECDHVLLSNVLCLNRNGKTFCKMLTPAKKIQYYNAKI